MVLIFLDKICIFDNNRFSVVHFVSSLLPYDQLTQEPLREVLPNRDPPTFFHANMELRNGCDAVFYERWKYIYHRAQTRLALLQRKAQQVMRGRTKSSEEL
eukprot:TRINITY_DN296_c0_g1_i4.p2 TRINITY_DN296_c0_g1~~TRINITY_DN296_c0_g1_i4.p2  ORF type:complete len:101 (-),score=11.25 TRINITY_DN296_c0_g1_i4:100-402(-)